MHYLCPMIPESWDLEDYKSSESKVVRVCLFPAGFWALPTVICLRSSVEESRGVGRIIPALPTHRPKHRKGRFWGRVEGAPTSEHDTTKDSVVPVQCGAVPAMVAELVLTLSDPFPGTFAHRAHDVWIALAQLPLPAHQARDIVTDHSSA